MPLIDIHEVHRSYGPVQALAGVSLKLEPGSIGLVGNNGAGKSTLLKILLGLLAPDSGKGTVLGYDLERSGSQLRGRVGYMPEAAAIVPMLKGVEFVVLSGDLYGMPHGEARRRAHEVLDYVGVGELRYRPLQEYSSGNLQRLKLAAALVHDPELLLLDEPTSGLDPGGRVSFLQLLEDLIAETGKSVILSTHLLGDIERLCDVVVFLHHGQVVHCGPRAEFKRAVRSHYEVGWQGEGEAFVGRLAEAGATIKTQNESRLVAMVPEAWHSSQFFRLARESDVLITELKSQEENLEQLFFRMTNKDGSDGN